MAETPPLPARKAALEARSLQRPETAAAARPEAGGALSFCGCSVPDVPGDPPAPPRG